MFTNKTPHCIYNGTIPVDYGLDSVFAFADKNKQVSVHFQYYNCPDLTILYIFQIKKITHILLSVFLCKEKLSCTV